MIHFTTSVKDITSGPTGPTRAMVPSAQAKKLSAVDARVSRVALPTIATLSAAMNAAGRKILNAVLFIPSLICTTMIKAAKCVLSCLIPGFRTSEVEDPEADGLNKASETDSNDSESIESESLGAYRERLNELSLMTPEEERTVSLAERPPIFYRNTQADYRDASPKKIKAAVLYQLGRDLLSVLNSNGNYRTLTINGNLYRLTDKISAHSSIEEQQAVTRPVVESIYNEVNQFYLDTEPSLSDEERLDKVVLVLDNINQGSGSEALRMANLLGDWMDAGCGPSAPSNTDCDPMSIQLEMNRQDGTVRVINTYSMPILTMDAIERHAVKESLGTFKATTVIDITYPADSTISYQIAMK